MEKPIVYDYSHARWSVGHMTVELVKTVVQDLFGELVCGFCRLPKLHIRILGTSDRLAPSRSQYRSVSAARTVKPCIQLGTRS